MIQNFKFGFIQFNKIFIQLENQGIEHHYSREVLRRTGGGGFPVLSNVFDDSKISTVMRGLHRAGASALVYVPNTKHCCTEAEVEEWLKKRRSGEEKRCLLADQSVSRGWEASHTLVLGQHGEWENLVMRTVGYCALVKKRQSGDHVLPTLEPLRSTLDSK